MYRCVKSIIELLFCSDSIPGRKNSATNETLDEKGSLRKKAPTPVNSLKANFTGHFYNEPAYMRFYENLRAAYSNHKVSFVHSII